MPTSSAAVSSLALAVLGLGAVPAFAQGPTVAAVGDRQDAARSAVVAALAAAGTDREPSPGDPVARDGQPIPEAAPPPLFGGAAAGDNRHGSPEVEGKIRRGARARERKPGSSSR